MLLLALLHWLRLLQLNGICGQVRQLGFWVQLAQPGMHLLQPGQASPWKTE